MEWIKFSDEMPKHNQYIKVKSDGLWHGEGIFQDGKFVYSWVKGACYGNPTHWKPNQKKVKNGNKSKSHKKII
jgi:hypothetical protein